MAEPLRKWDPAERIKSPEDARDWLRQFEADGTPEEFADALGDIARAYGMMRLAEETGIPIETLYAAVNRRPIELDTLLPILEALGVKHSASPANAAE